MINMTLKLKTKTTLLFSSNWIHFKALFTLIYINTFLLICFKAKRKLCYHVGDTKKSVDRLKNFRLSV